MENDVFVKNEFFGEASIKGAEIMNKEKFRAYESIIQLEKYKNILTELKFIIDGIKSAGKGALFGESIFRNGLIAIQKDENKTNCLIFEDNLIRTEILNLFLSFANYKNGEIIVNDLKSKAIIVESQQQQKELQLAISMQQAQQAIGQCVVSFGKVWYTCDAIALLQKIDNKLIIGEADCKDVFEKKNPELFFPLLIDHITKVAELIYKEKIENEGKETNTGCDI